MKRTVTIPATIISILLGIIIAYAGSQGSEIYNGIALFALCASVSYLLHWIIFIPSYIFQTEHYFDLTGSISYLVAIGLGFYLNPSMDPRDLLIGALIVIWALRLGSFLFLRVKQDGKDNRFTVMKTQFHWYIMTWTIGGLWVFLTMAAGLAAITSNVNIPLGGMAYLGLALWIFGFSIEVIADRQKRNFKKQQDKDKEFITSGLWAWSRHPNYFFELFHWFAYVIMAIGLQNFWITLIPAISMFFFITRFTGIKYTEIQSLKSRGEDYRDYQKTTNMLIPWFPKRVEY